MSYLEHCHYRGFDGVVIACVNFYDAQILELVRSDIPVVTVDHLLDNRINITSDNVGGMEQLVRYIYDKGHRQIAYIHGADSSVTQARLTSFHRTAELLGLKLPPEYVRESPYRDTRMAEQVTRELLDLKKPPTCILYPDDFSCFGGITAIKGQGLRIPEDISVAGYDGIRIGRHIEPPLTTFRQDTAALGAQAGEKLIALIEHPKTTLVEQVVIKGELYPGKTVGAI